MLPTLLEHGYRNRGFRGSIFRRCPAAAAGYLYLYSSLPDWLRNFGLSPQPCNCGIPSSTSSTSISQPLSFSLSHTLCLYLLTLHRVEAGQGGSEVQEAGMKWRKRLLCSFGVSSLLRRVIQKYSVAASILTDVLRSTSYTVCPSSETAV